jgi:hypothetical protein
MPQTIFGAPPPSSSNKKKKVFAWIVGIAAVLAFAYAWSQGWIS